jgi:glycosyltransferase involved in cell wall biosynthesis
MGQLIPRKGLDILIKSLKRLSVQNWMLDIYGSGPSLQDLIKLVNDFELQNKIHFRGSIANSETRGIYSDYDLLLLPSRFDGWGAVINEALMSGTPVLCSDTCGAKDLVTASGGGAIFHSESISSLKAELETIITKGKPTEDQRSKLIDWSKSIEGSSIAKYFIDIAEYMSGQTPVRPLPPFLNAEQVLQILSFR